LAFPRSSVFLVAAVCQILFLAPPVVAKPETDDLEVLTAAGRFPHPDLMVYDYLGNLAADFLEQRRKLLELLKTPRDWENRRRYVIDRVKQSVGPFPRRTPLNPVITGIYRGDGFRVEKIIYQSQPGLYVTANLYLPDPLDGPVPAFINPVGHWHQGKVNETYRRLGVILARRGYAAFIYDPIGQGERLQYYNPDSGVSFVGGNIYPHNMVGKQCLLTDRNLTNYFLWDGVRAIDYLATRAEIDISRIVCAGASGGGAQTQYISPIDERIKISIPVVSVGGRPSTRPVPYRGGIGDCEQNLFWSLNHGIVQADWLACLAPRPLFIIAASGDRGGTVAHGAVYYEVRELYSAFGADSSRVAELVYYGRHGWPDEAVAAACDWADKWFKRKPRKVKLPVQPPPRDSLLCTETGQVVTALGGETIFSLVKKRACQIAPRRLPLKEISDLEAYSKGIKSKIMKLTGFRRSRAEPRFQIVGKLTRGDVEVVKLVYYPEPGIYVPSLVFRPLGSKGEFPAILYLPQGGGHIDGMATTQGSIWNSNVRFEEGGKAAEARAGGLLEDMARAGAVVMAIDYRGIGETLVRPTSWDRTTSWFGPQNFGGEAGACYFALKMGLTMFGLRLVDCIAGIEVLRKLPGVDRSNVAVAGRSMGALLALYTAALNSGVKSVLAERSLVSYRSLVESPIYHYHFNIFIPRVLANYDLDDVAALVAPRTLVFLNMVNQKRFRLTPEECRGEYRRALSAYTLHHAAAGLKFVVADSRKGVHFTYRKWIGEALGRK